MVECQPLFWAVVRDGKGKWTVVYDPELKMKNGKRFAFQAYADDYKKQMTLKDKAAQAALAAKQRDLL